MKIAGYNWVGNYFRFWVTILTSFLLLSGVVAAYTTGTYGSGAYGTCQYGAACSISVSSNGSLSLNITPAAGGKCTIQSDSVSVLTDDTNGYTLTLNDSSTSTALTNGASTIPASGGTVASPTAIAANTWGYRVDGLGGFGSGPTTSQTNISPNGTLIAGIEASNQTADTIATHSGAANPAVSTTVWYAVCADTSVPSGSYSSQAVYTAVAN
ncbi:MAG TPA: hypothetical protein VFK97_02640 [Candidatus Saccharimonadales bacterium]|nr:hypothetical protein [Candidatus Saccharimonadales bacterium]